MSSTTPRNVTARAVVGCLLVALVAIGLLPAGSAIARGRARYIVVLKDTVSSPAAVARTHGRTYGLRVSHVYGSAIKGYAATLPPSALARLREDPRVASISPERPMRILAQTNPTGIRRIDAELSSTLAGNGSGSVGTHVAVIDTGIDLDHPDLHVVGGTNCSTGTGFDDGHGHGSHVAGTIGARDNDLGVVGVAPGVPLWSVRVLDNSGSGTNATVLCGVDWVDSMAPANGGPIRVANMSIGGPGSDDGACGSLDGDALHAGICQASADGVLFVAAAGNSGSAFTDQIPAAYDEVLTVTAITDVNGRPGGSLKTCLNDADDTAAEFSDFATAGSPETSHVIAGPGACIKSTWKNAGYRWLNGTSMATPHVTGTAALCIANETGCAGLSASQLLQKLRADAAARPASYGFLGDPTRPITRNGVTRYYGFLVYAGGY